MKLLIEVKFEVRLLMELIEGSERYGNCFPIKQTPNMDLVRKPLFIFQFQQKSNEPTPLS